MTFAVYGSVKAEKNSTAYSMMHDTEVDKTIKRDAPTHYFQLQYEVCQ